MNNKLIEQLDYVNHLNDELKSAIKYYSGSGYRDINPFLLEMGKTTLWVRENIKKLDEAFLGVPPLLDPIIVYRGISGTDEKSIRLIISTYISTSLSEYAASEFIFERCCLLRITLTPGSKILPIWTISTSPKEYEVLLYRSGKFIITKVSKDYKYDIYDIIYIPPESIQLNGDIYLSEIKDKLLTEEYVEKILSYVHEEDLLINGIRNTVENIAKGLGINYNSLSVPENPIEIAILRLQNTS